MMWSIGKGKQFSVLKNKFVRLNSKAFSLIEVMISVAILSIGLVVIIQGFITAINTLQTAENRIYIRQFLEQKIEELEQEVVRKGGIPIGESSGEIKLGGRGFSWALDIVPVGVEEDLDLSEKLNEVKLTVFCQEAGRGKDVSLFTYLENREEVETE